MKAAVAVLFASSSAFAQAPGDVAPAPYYAPAPVPEPRVVQTSEKDPTVAVMLSLGTTLGGVVLIAAGADENESLAMLGAGALFFGPSTGHWYAGRYGGYGMAGRAVSAGLMMYGIVTILAGGGGCDDFDDNDNCSNFATTEADERRVAIAMTVGALGWVGATVYDIITAPDAVRDYNRAHQMTIAPTVIPNGGSYTPGVAFSARF